MYSQSGVVLHVYMTFIICVTVVKEACLLVKNEDW